jgi:DNA polymerase-3 subunit beta
MTTITIPTKQVTEFAQLASKMKANYAMPILSCVLITWEGNEVYLRATNLDLELHDVLPAKTDGQIVDGVAIESKQLLNVLRSIKSEQVTFQFTDGEQITIVDNGMKVVLSYQDGIDFPNSFDFEPTRKLTFSGLFQYELAKQSNYRGTDDLRPQMIASYIDCFSNEIRMTATNAHLLRTTKFADVGEDFGSFGIMIPSACCNFVAHVDSVCKIGFRNVKVAFNDSHVEINFGTLRLVSKQVEGKYVNYKAVIPESKYKAKVSRKELIQNVSMALKSANASAKQVVLEFKENGELEISSEDLDNKQSFQTSQNYDVVSDDFEPLKIVFNGVFLQMVFKSIDEAFVELDFSAANRPMTIQSHTTTVLLMPVILNK